MDPRRDPPRAPNALPSQDRDASVSGGYVLHSRAGTTRGTGFSEWRQFMPVSAMPELICTRLSADRSAKHWRRRWQESGWQFARPALWSNRGRADPPTDGPAATGQSGIPPASVLVMDTRGSTATATPCACRASENFYAKLDIYSFLPNKSANTTAR